jgi:hypothetical protein
VPLRLCGYPNHSKNQGSLPSEAFCEGGQTENPRNPRLEASQYTIRLAIAPKNMLKKNPTRHRISPMHNQTTPAILPPLFAECAGLILFPFFACHPPHPVLKISSLIRKF